MLSPTKGDYINEILNYISGTTNINYQKNVGIILRMYYRQINKKFTMPAPFGGDDKNDGWVKEDAIFYQIYSPLNIKNSFKQDIKNKYEEDLTELLKKLFIEKKWNGIIKQFIFIVNTFDNDLPHDSEGFYDSITNKLMKDYNFNFTYEIISGNIYLRDLLQKINDIELLKNISDELRLYHSVIKETITSPDIYDLIVTISGNINIKYINPNENKPNYYERNSTQEKIKINNLLEKENDFDNILENLDVVDKAVKNINLDTLDNDKFEDVKNYIIHLYTELSKNYEGVALFEKICDQTSKKAKMNNQQIAIEYLIVYIFDSCDIFEKEEKELNNNDIA